MRLAIGFISAGRKRLEGAANVEQASDGPFNWKRPFWIIASTQGVSLIGSSAVQFALLWWLAATTGSPLTMGVAGLVGYLPTALLSPVGGIVADRYDRVKVCIASDLAIGAVAVVFGIMLLVADVPLWMVLAALFLRGVGTAFENPAFSALTPQYVPKEHLLKANGWVRTVSSCSYILSPVVGAALYVALPLWLILILDMAGALVACAGFALAPIPKLDRSTASAASLAASASMRGQLAQAWREIAEGLDVFREDRGLLAMLLVQTACMIFFMPLASFFPLMTSDYFGGSAWHGSVVETAYAIGMLVSAAYFGTVAKVRRHLAVAYLGYMGVGFTAVISGLMPPNMVGWMVFVGACGLMGAFGTMYGIALNTYVQITVDPLRMGRAFSTMNMVESVASPVGLLIASPIAEATGIAMWFLIAGLGIMAAAGSGLASEVRRQRRD